MFQHQRNPTLAGSGIARSAGESAYPALWTGLIGLWAAYVGHQGLVTLRDWSPFARHGSWVGTPTGSTWTVAQRGICLDFDGVNDAVNLGTSADLTPLRDISLVAYARSDLGSTSGMIVTRSTAGVVDPYMLRFQKVGANLDVRFSIDTGTTTNLDSGTVSNSTTEWRFAAGTYDGATMTCYHAVGGGPMGIATAAKTGNLAGGTDNIVIGSFDDATVPLDGMLSFVAIYSSALARREIEQYRRWASPLHLKRLVVGKTPGIAAALYRKRTRKLWEPEFEYAW